MKLVEVPLLAILYLLASSAEDYLDMDLNLHEYLVQNPAATFVLE